MMFSRNMKRLVVGVCVLASLTLGVRWPFSHASKGAGVSGEAEQKSRDDDAASKGTADAVPVNVAQVELRDMPITMDAIGTVQAINTAMIRTQVNGRLTKLWFKDGEDVRKGDMLASIEPSLYQAQYDQTVAKKAQDEANLSNARLDLARYKKLTVGQYGSQQQYDTQKHLVAQLEAQLRADQASIDSARTTLEYCSIRSPLDGRAGLRLVDVGNILHDADPNGIVTITQLKPIYVTFTLPQQALLEIQSSMERGRPRVMALGPDNATVIDTGEVSAIDNAIDQATGTAKIRAIMPNSSLRLWPGQFVNARVTVDTVRKAIVVPLTAIQQGTRGAFVYVVNKDKSVTVKSVTTGVQNEHFVVVKSGLDSGSRVVVSGFSRLTDGAKVQIVASEKEQKAKRDQDALNQPKREAKPLDIGDLKYTSE